MTTETRSPNDEAQASIARWGLASARNYANMRVEETERAWRADPTQAKALKAQHARDVATLLRLETQDDEPAREEPTPRMPSFGWPNGQGAGR